ncbi:signal recognition particle-docking protein FtsY [Pacificimonas flava]|uniref:Signal recognition particle receptor FtsY n=2 Tax=Pacificimonas TaxID=1960290 RepID=A0A219B1G2_9SPHN|nr:MULTISPECIES: signal recognition particle-docking protein FtsY [Pacificimonas]MBZ6380068.1 signal recognition particle-docking protein FtsY [Pacificimonas aurantium]OWV32034.1 signal recognition particle-docking protein FtsY [Pacificimonas flava]
MTDTDDFTPKVGWLKRLRAGLGATSDKLSGNLAMIERRPLDDDMLEEIEDALIASDLGPAVAGRITAKLAADRFGDRVSEGELRELVAAEVERVLMRAEEPLEVTAFPRPHTILVVGVNGSGKTTTIAKLAHLFQEQDYNVMLAAGDTFRAAAVEQLQVWGDRLNVPVISTNVGGDAASLAFDALTKAWELGTDVLIIDTAGRLQNKQGLMDELAKIKRVLKRRMEAAPHDTVLVLDATTGQNALSQIDTFKEVAGVTGLVMTKLDGTARGGVLVAASDRSGLKLHAIGVGEKLGDLRPFDPRSFARALAGLPTDEESKAE